MTLENKVARSPKKKVMVGQRGKRLIRAKKIRNFYFSNRNQFKLRFTGFPKQNNSIPVPIRDEKGTVSFFEFWRLIC